jgi:hypothetical protein
VVGATSLGPTSALEKRFIRTVRRCHGRELGGTDITQADARRRRGGLGGPALPLVSSSTKRAVFERVPIAYLVSKVEVHVGGLIPADIPCAECTRLVTDHAAVSVGSITALFRNGAISGAGRISEIARASSSSHKIWSMILFVRCFDDHRSLNIPAYSAEHKRRFHAIVNAR